MTSEDVTTENPDLITTIPAEKPAPETETAQEAPAAEETAE